MDMLAADERALGARLQEVRRSKGFTQQHLCNAANLSYSTLAKIERGAIKAPSIFTIQSIATALGVGLDDLLGQPGGGSAPAHLRRSKSGVSFVYFDVNSTLVYATLRGFSTLSAKSGVLPDVIESTYWHYNDAVCRGTMSLSDFNKTLSAKLGIAVDWESVYLDSAEAIEPVQELLAWAAQHYRVGLMSNTMPGFLHGLLRRGILPKLPYAVIIDSSEVGAVKPEPDVYQAAQTAASVPAREIMLIDDIRANLVAAEKLGWHVGLLDTYQVAASVDRLRLALEPTGSY